MNPTISILISALVSLLAVKWVFLRILKIAKMKGMVDNPNARKLQKRPIPVLGGIAVFFGLLCGVLTFTAMHTDSIGEVPTNLLPIIVGAGILLYTGAIDDIMGLTPRNRLVIEVLVVLGIIFGSGMCMDNFHGLWGIYQFSWWLAVPLTVFCSVGIINAYNMVDGVNGLSSGLCIACSLALSLICWKRGDYADCAFTLCYAASLFPFLLHNVFGHRSRMFIGDAGTMVMGLLVSWYAIRILSSQNIDSYVQMVQPYHQLGLVAMMISVACVPVADTLRVMTARMMRGVSPFSADRTHLHHVFIACGVSHSVTAFSEVLINVLVMGLWYLTFQLGFGMDVQFYMVVASSVILVWGTYFFLVRFVKTHPNAPYMKWTRSTHMSSRAWWKFLEKTLDKGSYEDYLHIYQEKVNKRPEEMTETDRDTVAIVNYLQGKKAVKMEDITAESGASEKNILPILIELNEENVIDIVGTDENNNPTLIRLNELG